MNTNGKHPPRGWADLAEWITTADAAGISGYDVQYVRFLARTGKIGAEKKGRDWWIDRDKFRTYLAVVEELGTKKFDPRGAIPQAKPTE